MGIKIAASPVFRECLKHHMWKHDFVCSNDPKVTALENEILQPFSKDSGNP